MAEIRWKKAGKAAFSMLAGLFLSLLAELCFLMLTESGGLIIARINWLHIVSGFLIYSALILACGSGKGRAAEKQCRQVPAGETGRVKKIFELLLIRVLFAGDLLLLAYLFMEKTWNLYRLIFLIPLVLLAEIPLLRVRQRPELDRIVQIAAFVWLIYAIVYYILIYRISWSDAAPFNYRLFQRPGRRIMQTAGAVLFLYEIPKKPYRAAVSTAIYLFLVAAYQIHGAPWLSNYMMFVLLANLFESPRKTAKVCFWSLLGCAGLILIIYFHGWSVPMIRERSGLTVNSFGLKHTNNVALTLMVLLMLGWYIWLQKKPFVSLAVLTAGTAGIWVLSTSRSSLIVLALFIILLLPWYFTVRKNRTGWMKLIVLAPLLTVAVSVILIRFVPDLQGKIDRTFLARFSFPVSYLANHPLTWMGSRDAANIVLDNLPWYLILRHGMLSCALFFGMYTWASIRFCRNRQWAELLLLLLFMVFSIMENSIIYISSGFVPLLVTDSSLNAADRCPDIAEMSIAKKPGEVKGESEA